jgi:hypothetical protein
MYSTPPKADDVFNQKVIYLCTQKGCGAQISEFPAAEKNPAPKYCKLCQSKERREEIQKGWDAIIAAQKEKK